MFKIAICEDQRIFSEAQANTCKNVLERQNIKYQMSVFTSSADFLKAFITQQQRYDMILLDIVMDGVDGIELARTIRQYDEDTAIVFVTSYGKYALQGYDVKALHYLMKPVDAKLLENLIKSVYAKRPPNDSLTIKTGDHHVRVPVKEIVCMEIEGRRVKVSLTEGIVYYSGKLTEILSKLPNDLFIRCHQAFAVNIGYIRELSRSNAIAVNGKAIPVSRTFWHDTKTAFLRRMNAI